MTARMGNLAMSVTRAFEALEASATDEHFATMATLHGSAALREGEWG